MIVQQYLEGRSTIYGGLAIGCTGFNGVTDRVLGKLACPGCRRSPNCGASNLKMVGLKLCSKLLLGFATGAGTVVLVSVGFSILKTGLRIIGCCQSKPCKANPPSGIKPLNDHVWELHSPRGDPKIEIILFHGIQLADFKDAFWETWVSENDKLLVWPKEWLSKEFPHARILSISYNSSVTQKTGQLCMYTLAENLVHDIILGTKHKIGQNCPVFLVGNCFGRIVIKQLIISAKRQEDIFENDKNCKQEFKLVNTFLKNFSGVFYYATPHGGSKLANLASRLPGTSPILELVNTLSTETARINNDFRRHRTNLNVRAFGLAESWPCSYIKGFDTIVVEEASTRQDIDYFYTHGTADHFSICKARDERDPTVIEMLAQFILNAVPEELKEKATVDPQPEGDEQTNSLEEPQSHLGSATRKLSENVERFISSVNDKAQRSYSLSKEWWGELSEEEKEALQSAFKRYSYRHFNESPTAIFYQRNQDKLQV